jgi:hypothetical protein
MTERLALMVAAKVRDLLRPVMPMATIAGKRGKIKPVVFIQNIEGTRTVYYAVPEGTKLPQIPSELHGISIKSKAWEGPAPEDVQKLALKAFGAKK